MTTLWLWAGLAPLLAIPFLLRWPAATPRWLWLACVPAMVAAVWLPPVAALPNLWPGAQWGVTDLTGRALLTLTALLWALAALFAAGSQRDDPNRTRFWIFWLLALCGNLVLVMAGDGVSFFVGFTVMSLSAYGLVVHKPGPEPRRAGRIYLQLAVLGEMFLYAALILRFQEAGGSQFALWQVTPVGDVTALLLMLGLGLKAGFFPLHVWLPLAHPVAPAAASAVLSGAMIKAGILGLWRFAPEQGLPLDNAATVLLALGLFGAFYGVVLGLLQTRVKTLLAYSSVSQMGYLLAILALAWQQPELRPWWGAMLALYAVHHGFAKGALFMAAGISSGHRLPTWLLTLTALPALALAGLPLTGGALAKVLLKEGMAAGPFAGWLPLFTLGSLATGVLVARALWLMHLSAEPSKPPPSKTLWLPVAALCLASPALPWLWPGPLADLLLTPDNLWASLWPVILALLVTGAVLASGWRLPTVLTRLPNPVHRLSLGLKSLLGRPPLPEIHMPQPGRQSRRWEREWNRMWHRADITFTIRLLCILLLLAWFW